MSSFVLKDAEVFINAVDLSDHVLSLTVNYEADLQEDTAMSSTFTRSRVAGLLDWSMDIKFKQDFDSGSVDETLFSLVGAAAFAISAMANRTNGVGPTNPKFNGNALIQTYPPLTGDVGQLNTITAKFMGVGALTRSVA